MKRLLRSLWSKISRRPLITVCACIIGFWTMVVWFGPRDEGLGTIVYREQNREALTDSGKERFSFTCLVNSVKEKTYGLWIQARITEAKQDFLLNTFIEGYVSDIEVQAGDIIQIYGKLSLPEAASNPGQFDAQTYYALRTTDYLLTTYSSQIVGRRNDLFVLLERWRRTLSNNLFEILPDVEAGIASAIVLGTSDLVDLETKELFQGAGIAHLLAVSGLHVMSFFNVIGYALNKVLGKRLGSAITIMFVWSYVVLTGGSVSAIRAGLMLSFKVAATVFCREDDPLISYLVPATIIVCVEPLYLTDSGFWLSFGAMMGIRFLDPIIQRIPQIPYFLRKALGSSLSVLLFTTPISLWFYYAFNPYSLFLNPIVIPFMTYVYILSAIGALVCSISPILGRFVVGLVYFILRAYIGASKWLNSLPGARWLIGRPEWWQMVGYYLLIFMGMAFLNAKKESKRRFWYLWMTPTICCLLALFPYRQDQVIFLNVGQGDAAVIECEGKVYLVDAGPSYSQVIKPYLLSRGISYIDGIFLSHPDADHMAGVASLLQDAVFEVGALFVGNTSYSEKDEYNKLLTSAPNVVSLSAGQTVINGNMSFLCLSPQKGKQYVNDNDASMVLYFSCDTLSVYFMGDIEESGELSLLARLPQDGVSDGSVIKIAHHGSRTSTCEALLNTLTIKTAIISAKKSVYGHPHEETLSRLQEHGFLWYITEYTGAIRLTRKGLKCYN